MQSNFLRSNWKNLYLAKSFTLPAVVIVVINIKYVYICVHTASETVVQKLTLKRDGDTGGQNKVEAI